MAMIPKEFKTPLFLYWIFLLFIGAAPLSAEGLVCPPFPMGWESWGIQKRIGFWCDYFLETPYSGGPLGEGVDGEFDQDPLIRFEKFDCTTLVETILALSHSVGKKDLLPRLNKIRYRNGEVSYFNRNHFTSLHWIPHQITTGLLANLSEKFLKNNQAQQFNAQIDPRGWYLSKKISDLNRLHSESDEINSLRLEKLRSLGLRHLQVPYLVSLSGFPKEKFSTPQALNLNPGFYVASIIKKNWKLKSLIGTDLLIGHQGFLQVQPGGLFFIHASLQKKKVVKEPLFPYLNSLSEKTFGGLHLLVVIE